MARPLLRASLAMASSRFPAIAMAGPYVAAVLGLGSFIFISVQPVMEQLDWRVVLEVRRLEDSR